MIKIKIKNKKNKTHHLKFLSSHSKVVYIYVQQLGCLRKYVASLPMQITLG